MISGFLYTACSSRVACRGGDMEEEDEVDVEGGERGGRLALIGVTGQTC